VPVQVLLNIQMFICCNDYDVLKLTSLFMQPDKNWLLPGDITIVQSDFSIFRGIIRNLLLTFDSCNKLEASYSRIFVSFCLKVAAVINRSMR
jgi:hypothetical protein